MKRRKTIVNMVLSVLTVSIMTFATINNGLHFTISQPVYAAESDLEPLSFGATPNEEQLWYMKQGLSAFVHFGPNTFHDVEWGEGYYQQDPKEVFPLTTDFDEETLVKTLKEAGFSRIIVTAKHHDGFCLWASDHTTYDIASTNYKGGEGDILEEISDACTKYNMDMGIYLSPWDIYEDRYGCFGDQNNRMNSGGYTDYNEYYIACINEIVSATKIDHEGNVTYKYGNNHQDRRSDRFVEWWLDGARGSANNLQTYDFRGIMKAVKNENPNCQIFGTHAAEGEIASTGGIHWIGNESGVAADETWAKVNSGSNYESLRSNGYIRGIANGDTWSVPECDTPILADSWFHSDTKESRLKSLDTLMDLYYQSVGHGATLLLNVSPNSKGTIDSGQKARIIEFGEEVKSLYKNDITETNGVTTSASSVYGNSSRFSADKVIDSAEHDDTYWAPASGSTTGSVEIIFPESKTFDLVSLEEYIPKGQTISSFSVEYQDIKGSWQLYGSGSTISSKRLIKGETVEAKAVRLNILSALSTPMISDISVYDTREATEEEKTSDTMILNGTKTLEIEAEDFLLDASNANRLDQYVRITDHANASGGKEVNWFEQGNRIVLPVTVERAGSYRVTAVYRSGRVEGWHTPNAINWSGQNIKSGSVDVYGESNADQFHEAEFEIIFTDTGDTELIFTADKKAGPVLDRFILEAANSFDSEDSRDYNDTSDPSDSTTSKDSEETSDPSDSTTLIRFPVDESSLLVEGEDLELDATNAINPDHYVRVTEHAKASGGKELNWFENGNVVRLPFYAEEQGTYRITVTYRSGRVYGWHRPNVIHFSGDSLSSGSVSVYGEINADRFHQTEFDLDVAGTGEHVLVFTTDSNAGPVIDTLEIRKAKG